MKKEIREKVYLKYGKKCGYCGKDIEYKDMQVDHIIPKRSFLFHVNAYNYDPKNKGDHFDNLNPSCRRCNHYKRAYSLEDFRKLMTTLHHRISKEYINKVAIDYGVIELKPFDGVFYFEEQSNITNNC